MEVGRVTEEKQPGTVTGGRLLMVGVSNQWVAIKIWYIPRGSSNG